mgnify:CR=1 FL=1
MASEPDDNVDDEDGEPELETPRRLSRKQLLVIIGVAVVVLIGAAGSCIGDYVVFVVSL